MGPLRDSLGNGIGIWSTVWGDGVDWGKWDLQLKLSKKSFDFVAFFTFYIKTRIG